MLSLIYLCNFMCILYLESPCYSSLETKCCDLAVPFKKHTVIMSLLVGSRTRGTRVVIYLVISGAALFSSPSISREFIRLAATATLIVVTVELVTDLQMNSYVPARSGG